MSTPSATVMVQAAKVALQQDRPIYLDYYEDSVQKKCCIGVQGTTKMLVKSDTEYTSPIESIMRIKEDNTWIILNLFSRSIHISPYTNTTFYYITFLCRGWCF